MLPSSQIHRPHQMSQQQNPLDSRVLLPRYYYRDSLGYGPRLPFLASSHSLLDSTAGSLTSKSSKDLRSSLYQSSRTTPRVSVLTPNHRSVQCPRIIWWPKGRGDSTGSSKWKLTRPSYPLSWQRLASISLEPSLLVSKLSGSCPVFWQCLIKVQFPNETPFLATQCEVLLQPTAHQR